MRVIYGIENLSRHFRRPVLAIGIFDGLHLGHRQIIRRLIRAKEQIHGRSVILTFEPHPLKILKGKKFLPLIISLEHRLKLFEELNIDVCIVVDFNNKFARIDAEAFIKQVVRKIFPCVVIVGENFRFGKDLKGDIALLKQLSLKYGFKLQSVPLLKIGARRVSSTYIRSLIQNGTIKEVSKFLGRPLSILGEISPDRGRGKILGFPTANLDYHHEVIPPDGVYLVRIIFKKRIYGGLCYIGRRPTFFKSKIAPRAIEVHILGFNRNIYGKNLLVEFIKKVRPEKRFSSAEELIRQLNIDRDQALQYFSSL